MGLPAPEFRRRHAGVFFKYLVEIAGILIAYKGSDFGGRNIRVFRVFFAASIRTPVR